MNPSARLKKREKLRANSKELNEGLYCKTKSETKKAFPNARYSGHTGKFYI